jgi:tetratricopeptide (TPR) repeat protein
VKTNPSLGFYFRILLVGFFIAVLGLGPTPHAVRALMEHARRSASSGEFLSAANDLVGIANYFPWRSELNVEAAHYALHAGDAKSAIQFFEHPGMAAYLSTDDLILLGDAYKQSGNTSKAESIWKDVTEGGESTQAYQRLAELSLEQNDYASAISWLQKLLSINPSDSKLYYQIGLLYAVTEPLKALPFLAQAAEIDLASATEAKDLHDKIRTANLFDQPAYILLASGRQLANMGKWGYAAEAFRRATELNPDYTDAWAFLGEARQQISKQETGATTDEGLSELQRALQLDADSVLANTFMGLYWERQQDYPQAQQYLEHAIEMNPDDPYLYSELGNIISKAGDLPAAQAAYESAIQLTPQDPLFYRLLAGFAMENQIQIRELALPAARQAVLLNPHDPDSLDVMAQVMLMLQDYYSAERYSLDALQTDPGFAPAYLHLGTAYFYLGEPDLAYQWLGRAKNVGSESWVAAQASRMLDYYFSK